MVYVTDAQIAQFKRHGYLILPNFLNEEETAAAQRGFFSCYADRWEERGKKPATRKGQCFFPWTDPGLNEVCVHHDLIDACERIIGSKEIRLCEAHCGIKYAEPYASGKVGGTAPGHWHQDYGNNTLGPCLKPADDDFQQVICFYLLDDVRPGMAPIQMLSNEQTDVTHAEAVIVPAGSACFYSVYTMHAASDWDLNLAPTGHRPTMHVCYSNASRNRLWDGGRSFHIKGSASDAGHGVCMAWFSPRQLNAAFMLPMPGDVLWTDDYLTKWCERWPAFDRTPYDRMRAMEGCDNGQSYENLRLNVQLRIFRKEEMSYLVPGPEVRGFVRECSKWGWANERICCEVPTSEVPGAVPILCLRKQQSAFYCHASWDGLRRLTDDGWYIEKEAAFFAFPPDAAPADAKPVHEWCKVGYKFYYTLEDWSGWPQMESWGWVHQRIAFYVPTASGDGV